jgi:hypothetical protein
MFGNESLQNGRDVEELPSDGADGIPGMNCMLSRMANVKDEKVY